MPSQTFTTPGSTDWEAPAGVTEVFAECIGGGGAGGGALGNPATGGGGAGGNYAAGDVTVVPGNLYAVVVAAAVSGGQTTVGATGNTSSFNGTSVVATGGLGGEAGEANSSNGPGAVAETTGCVGTTIFAGGDGGTGVFTSGSGFSGGGGGGAGPSGTGGDASGGNQGLGADFGISGNGAIGVGNNSAGSSGAQAGGAGCGGKANNPTNRNGGNGSAWWVRLTWVEIESISEAPPANDLTGFALEFDGPDTEAATALDSVDLFLDENIPLAVAEAASAVDTVSDDRFVSESVSEAPDGDDLNGFALFIVPPVEAASALDDVTLSIGGITYQLDVAEDTWLAEDYFLYTLTFDLPDEEAVAVDAVSEVVRSSLMLSIVEDAQSSDATGATYEFQSGTIAESASGVDANTLQRDLNLTVPDTAQATDSPDIASFSFVIGVAEAAEALDTLVYFYYTSLQPAPKENAIATDSVDAILDTGDFISEEASAAEDFLVFILTQETVDVETPFAADIVSSRFALALSVAEGAEALSDSDVFEEPTPPGGGDELFFLFNSGRGAN